MAERQAEEAQGRTEGQPVSYANLTPDEQQFLLDHLTNLQHEVVMARINGHTWSTIANSMNLDEATVRGHHRRAIRKLANTRKDNAA